MPEESAIGLERNFAPLPFEAEPSLPAGRLSGVSSLALLQQARLVLDLEAEAITDLSARLSDSFENAVNLLYNCQGKVIVSGIGKSGHIGRKVAATLASTGTPAFFVHIAEL